MRFICLFSMRKGGLNLALFLITEICVRISKYYYINKTEKTEKNREERI